jgi:hypothetical protein
MARLSFSRDVRVVFGNGSDIIVVGGVTASKKGFLASSSGAAAVTARLRSHGVDVTWEDDALHLTYVK